MVRTSGEGPRRLRLRGVELVGGLLGGHAGGAWARTNVDSDIQLRVGVVLRFGPQDPGGWSSALSTGFVGSGAWVLGLEGTYSAAGSQQMILDCTPGQYLHWVPRLDVHHETTIQTLITGTDTARLHLGPHPLYVKGVWQVARSAANHMISSVPGCDILRRRHAQRSGLDRRHRPRIHGAKTSMGYVSSGSNTILPPESVGLQEQRTRGTGALAFVTNGSDVTADIHQVVVARNVAV